MKIVIDTNVLLVSLPRKSQFRPIFDALLQNKFDLAISTEILFEYEEVVASKNGEQVAYDLMKILTELKNVARITVYFNWYLISNDPDDDKYVDCAFAISADYLVTHDTDFNVLRKVDFPKINVISATEFLEILKQSDPT